MDKNKSNNVIPKMLDPLGAHWSQPSRSEILVDDENAMMDWDTMYQLKTYDFSFPTGVYPGKMWKRKCGTLWYLYWYGISKDIKKCSVNSREIIFT